MYTYYFGNAHIRSHPDHAICLITSRHFSKIEKFIELCENFDKSIEINGARFVHSPYSFKKQIKKVNTTK